MVKRIIRRDKIRDELSVISNSVNRERAEYESISSEVKSAKSTLEKLCSEINTLIRDKENLIDDINTKRCVICDLNTEIDNLIKNKNTTQSVLDKTLLSVRDAFVERERIIDDANNTARDILKSAVTQERSVIDNFEELSKKIASTQIELADSKAKMQIIDDSITERSQLLADINQSIVAQQKHLDDLRKIKK